MENISLEEKKSELRFRNLRNLSRLFEILSYSIMIFTLSQLILENIKSVFLLTMGALLYFICVWSLLGEINYES